ncbi:hypothetical protein ZOSMA_376G00030 [Zostera marina]|uniref:Uncharacterized protein n=1 Tax=Zostera marina TaxID=29655 RepID=A0A0K9P5J2_ZOSMR|nr:hypothetical protein ZOSMA_376G00030 [Zostera marina]
MADPSGTRRAIEENMLAIIDSAGVKESRDLHDDRMSFLEAVRMIPMLPTPRIYSAVFDIWRKDAGDLEAVMTCYQILTDLGKKYPRTYLSDSDKNARFGEGGKEVVVDKEVWSPFVVSFGGHVNESNSQNSNDLLDTNRFSLLLQEVVQALTEKESKDKHLSTILIKDMLLFEYLVNDIEKDFLPRHTVYKEVLNWTLLRESLLNKLVSSRRLPFKGFIKDCISVICNRVNLYDLKEDCDSSIKFGLSEIANKTHLSVQKLLILVMELDVIKIEAETFGYTSRADGMRTPALGIILDELMYNKDLIQSFLQGFSEAKWKLEIILQYFWMCFPKPSIKTRNSSKVGDNVTLGAVLTYVSDSKNNKRINRKITDVAMLLAYAFQVILYFYSLSPKYI